MPLQTLYTMVMEHDIKAGNVAIETAGTLHMREYYEVYHFSDLDKAPPIQEQQFKMPHESMRLESCS